MGLVKALAWIGILAILPLTFGCGSGSDSSREQRARTPEAAFSGLEDRLVSARAVELDFHVTAEGAVEANLRGGLRILEGGVTEVSARGRFAGQEVDLLLRSDGDRYEYGNGPQRASDETPRHLNEALLIGLTRMGILHNLAMLHGNAPPDGAAGGVREWAVAEGFSFEPADDLEEGASAVSFSLIVSGTPAGSASLEIDPDGNPVLRRQTVEFPDGVMHVVERYSGILITP